MSDIDHTRDCILPSDGRAEGLVRASELFALAAERDALRAEVEDLGNRLHHVHRLWANNEHALRAEVSKLHEDKQALRYCNDTQAGAIDALRAENERLRTALEEIASITVHSGGDIHGISPTAWRAAFGHAHAVARAALGDTP